MVITVDVLLSLKGYVFLSKQHQAAPAATYTIYTIEFRWISGRVGLSNFCQVLLPFLPYDLTCVVFSIYANHTLHTLPLLYQGFPRCHHPAGKPAVRVYQVETLEKKILTSKITGQSLGPPTLSFYWLLYLQYIFWTSKKILSHISTFHTSPNDRPAALQKPGGSRVQWEKIPDKISIPRRLEGAVWRHKTHLFSCHHFHTTWAPQFGLKTLGMVSGGFFGVHFFPGVKKNGKFSDDSASLNEPSFKKYGCFKQTSGTILKTKIGESYENIS